MQKIKENGELASERSWLIELSEVCSLDRLEAPACLFAAKAKGSGGVKTAKLYAWVALQTLPEEMVISPCLLDFLEKALETIPITPVERSYAGASQRRLPRAWTRARRVGKC